MPPGKEMKREFGFCFTFSFSEIAPFLELEIKIYIPFANQWKGSAKSRCFHFSGLQIVAYLFC